MSNQRPLQNKPYGAEQYDQDALIDKQQERLNQKKISLRIENEKYLRNHPEIPILIKDFLKEVYTSKPNDIREFAAKYFTQSDLGVKLENSIRQNDKIDEINKIIKNLNVDNLHELKSSSHI